MQQTVSHCATGSTRDAAKLVAQTVDNNRVHRRSHARETHLAMCAGTSLALATESCRRSCTPSSAQRPPVSMPRTTSLQRPAVSSGYVVSWSLRACGVRCVGVRFARTRQGGSQCDVDCQLSPGKTWEILCQHLDASAITCRDIHVHVPQQHVEHHPGSRFSANACQRTFSGSGAFLQTSTARTSSSMAPMGVKWCLASLAHTFSECEGQLQSFEGATRGTSAVGWCTPAKWGQKQGLHLRSILSVISDGPDEQLCGQTAESTSGSRSRKWKMANTASRVATRQVPWRASLEVVPLRAVLTSPSSSKRSAASLSSAKQLVSVEPSSMVCTTRLAIAGVRSLIIGSASAQDAQYAASAHRTADRNP